MTLSASVKPNVPKMILDFAYEFCNVSQRVEGALDALGEATWTWTAIDSNVKVDIQPLTAREIKNIGAGEEIDATHRAFFLSGVSFPTTYETAVAMRVEVDTTGDGSPDSYFRILDVNNWASHVEALLEPTKDE